MATHFPLLSYHVDTSHWTFQEAQDVGFTKMYGRNCHPSGTGFRSGPWTNKRNKTVYCLILYRFKWILSFFIPCMFALYVSFCYTFSSHFMPFTTVFIQYCTYVSCVRFLINTQILKFIYSLHKFSET